MTDDDQTAGDSTPPDGIQLAQTTPADTLAGPEPLTVEPATIYLREKLQRMFPGELAVRSDLPDLMNRGNSESLEHVVTTVLDSRLDAEDFVAFMAERGYFDENINIIDGDAYYGMPHEEIVKVLASQDRLLSCANGLVASQDALFMPRPSGVSYSNMLSHIAKIGGALATAIGIAYLNGKYQMPMSATVAEASLAAVGAYAAIGKITSLVGKAVLDSSRESKNRKLASGYGDTVEAAIEDHYQSLLKLKGRIDIRVPDADAEKMTP